MSRLIRGLTRLRLVVLATLLLRPVLGGASAAGEINGVVQDPDGKPIADATVVVGLLDTGTPNHHVLKTDGEGRFSWSPPPGEFSVYLCAYKEGWSLTSTSTWTGAEQRTSRSEAPPGQARAPCGDPPRRLQQAGRRRDGQA